MSLVSETGTLLGGQQLGGQQHQTPNDANLPAGSLKQRRDEREESPVNVGDTERLVSVAAGAILTGLGLSRMDTIAYVRSVVDLIVQLDRQGGQRGIAVIERTSDLFKAELPTRL